MNAVTRLLRLSAAPALALAFSMAVTAVVLAVSGHPPLGTLRSMVEYAGRRNTQVLIVNSAMSYYIAAVAVAVCFRMRLLNIGIDGQYRLGALAAATVGGYLALPAPIHLVLIVGAAMLAGAAWALIAAVLKVRRGVSEIISTIMLNYIATGIVAYMLQPGRLAEVVPGSNNIGTPEIPPSVRIPGISIPGATQPILGLGVIAIVVGVAYWYVVNRTTYGFDLRATGSSRDAALASGVNVRRMIITTMLVSGATAGLIGLPLLLGRTYTYSLDFPAGVAFTGIAIALLGRNHPIGIAAAALLFGFLDNANQILALNGIPKEIINITQGTIVISVVVSYEFVRRRATRAEQRMVGRSAPALAASVS